VAEPAGEPAGSAAARLRGWVGEPGRPGGGSRRRPAHAAGQMLVASDLGAARISTGTGLAVVGGRRQAQSAGPWRCRSLPARWRVAGSPWSAITARIWPCQASAEDRASFSWCGYRDPPEAASEPPGTRASRVGGATNCRAVSRHDDEVPRTLAVRRACARETAGNAQEGLVRHRPHHRDRPSCPSRCLEGTGGCSRQVNRGSGEATDPRDRLLRADHR